MKLGTIVTLSALLVFFAGRATADVGSTETLLPTAKISSELRAKVASEGPQDLIVVFDDAAIQEEASTLRRTLRATLNDQTILDLKASRLAAAKVQVLSKFASHELVVLREYSHLPISHVRVRSASVLDNLLANPVVIGIYENSVRYRAKLAQSLPLIRQPLAAAAGDQGSGTTVAVLDQRVDFTNSVFGSCTSPGAPSSCKVLVAQDAPQMPNDGLKYQDGHGTNVAATVLAVAPGSKIVSLNVFNGERATDTDIISAINWCVANASTYKIVAMNLSLGSGGDTAQTSSSPYHSAFASAHAAGILPVAAAGNNGYTNKIHEPASVVGAVSVGAVYDSIYGTMGPWEGSNCTDSTTAADQVTCFSNSASFLTLLAPGCRDDAGMISPDYMCGTSQAAPHVAGAVAVLRSAFPTETLDQTVTRLQNGVAVTDSRNGVTKPRLDLAKALSLSTCSYTVSPTTQSISAAGTTGNSISVTSATGCSWSAAENSNWITITSATSGSGTGAVQYYVAPNNGTTSRTGTIVIAGKTVTVTQAAGDKSLSNTTNLSSRTNIWLVDTYSYTAPTLNSVTIHADEIDNLSLFDTTGTLRLELWLSTTPFTDQGGNGWRVATYQIAVPGDPYGTLPPLSWFSNITATVPLVNLPAPGSYYANFAVAEYITDTAICTMPDHFCLVAIGGFSAMVFIPDVTAPTVPTGLTATPASASQINLNWNASTDDLGVTSYKIFEDGVLLGRVATPGASIVNLSPSSTHQFSVSACDAALNCSAQSAPATATTLADSNVVPVSGLWVINAENNGQAGRGFQVETSNGTLVFTYYGYNPDGHDHWYLAAGTLAGGSFSGDMTQYHNGTALGATYAPASASGSAGTVAMTFTSAIAGNITLPGEAAKSISKFSW